MDQFVKVLHKHLNHNGFQYKEGLNVDTVPFNPTGFCLPGGLYFTKLKYLGLYLDYGVKIAGVKIPSDAKVYAEPCGTKWKADKLKISNIRNIKDLAEWDDEKFCEKQFSMSSKAAIYIRANKEDRQISAINIDYRIFRYLSNPSFNVTKKAVATCGYMIQYTDLFDRYNYVKKRNRWTRVVKFLEGQIKEICRLSIRYNGATLQFIPEEFQTFEICKAALSHNRLAYGYIKNWDRFDQQQALELSYAFDC